jgi:hypothetical protein
MSKRKCSKELYTTFLRVTSERYSALSLEDASPIELSHDAVSNWLREKKCQPKDVWFEVKDSVLSESGVLIVDDVVISKSRSEKIELVHWMYSGAKHDVTKGIGITNLVWRNIDGQHCPVDYRIYDPPEDGKTKNDAFRDMLRSAKDRGLNPDCILADSWYSSLDNLKTIRNYGWNWVMGLKSNRRVNRGKTTLKDLDIPEDGLQVHLRGYGWITVFLLEAKNGRKDYVGTNLQYPSREEVTKYFRERWSVEVYHRELKQACGLGRCQSRTGRSQRNHIGLSIQTWIQMQKRKGIGSLTHYEQKWQVIKESISKQIEYELKML